MSNLSIAQQPNNAIAIEQKDGSLVVDSRLIATDLGIQHKNLLATIKKYLDRLERKDPAIFQTQVVKLPQGGTYEETYCYLNEQQATLLMTFSRNTDKVLDCKERLVDAFMQAKQVIPRQSEEIQSLKLQNEILEKQLQLRQLDNSMLTLHGTATVLALRGMSDQVVEVDRPVLEVIDERCGDRRRGMTTKQLNDFLKKKTGSNFRNGTDLKRFLELEAPELIDQVQRPINQDWIHEDNIDAAIKVLEKRPKQMLLGESQHKD